MKKSSSCVSVMGREIHLQHVANYGALIRAPGAILKIGLLDELTFPHLISNWTPLLSGVPLKSLNNYSSVSSFELGAGR